VSASRSTSLVARTNRPRQSFSRAIISGMTSHGDPNENTISTISSLPGTTTFFIGFLLGSCDQDTASTQKRGVSEPPFSSPASIRFTGELFCWQGG
jgi:hypothetical protein